MTTAPDWLIRSALFVPGDDERKLARATTAGADALIYDLEDAVAAERKADARDRVCAALAGPGPALRLVRVRVGEHALGDLQPGEWRELSR